MDAESIDRDVVFAQSRYDKGGGADYLNCPSMRHSTCAIEDVVSAELAPIKAFEEAKFFEACLPIEVMATRGLDTPRRPMKPVGLTDLARVSRPTRPCSSGRRTSSGPRTTWWASSRA